MPEFLQFILIISIFIVVFPLFWMSIVAVIGRTGGWHRLAQHYATDRTLTGDDFSWNSMRFGLMGNYRNSVNITVSFEGIYLRPVFFFRAGHKPLLIPWDAIAEVKQTRFGFMSGTSLQVQPHDGGRAASITLYGKQVMESIERHLPMSLQDGDEFA